MHSFWVRSNALLTNILLVAGCMALLTSLTDFVKIPKVPDVDITVKSLDAFKRTSVGDEVRIQAAVKADLRPYWTWNTKLMFVYVELEYLSDNNELNQISFHDDIVRRRPRVNIDRDVKQEYRIVSQDAQLRGRALNATLTWSIMPKVGILRQYTKSIPIGRMPTQYIQQRQTWGEWNADA